MLMMYSCPAEFVYEATQLLAGIAYDIRLDPYKLMIILR